MTTSETDISSYDTRSGSPKLDHDMFEELAVQDLSWAVNTTARYASTLHKIPGIFAWEESRQPLANLLILARSVALHRLRSSFDHIRRYDPELSKAMQATFEELPLEGKLRFMTAPETYFRITHLRREPADSIIALCNFLNGEAALHGLGPIDKDYVTAHGDFYYSEAVPESSPDTHRANKVSKNAIFAPRLAETITIDFASPNVAGAQETDEQIEYLQYSEAETALICEKLDDVLCRIERVSEPTAHLIKQYVKVIIPLKTGEPGTSGSTSQPRYPGRVLLRGVEEGSLGAIAGSLVHEATHQVLYILEWAGPFIVEDPDMRAVAVKSSWTGRDLPLHSFIHACFVWYSLSNFWALARSHDAFETGDVKRQLARSLSGFRDENPVVRLMPYAGMARYDVLKIIRTLRDRLEDVLT
jgi:hypothetical protein